MSFVQLKNKLPLMAKESKQKISQTEAISSNNITNNNSNFNEKAFSQNNN